MACAPDIGDRALRVLRTSLKIHGTLYLLVNALLIGIWAASGGGYFWPIWPMLGWGLGLFGHRGQLALSSQGGRPPSDPPNKIGCGRVRTSTPG